MILQSLLKRWSRKVNSIRPKSKELPTEIPCIIYPTTKLGYTAVAHPPHTFIRMHERTNARTHQHLYFQLVRLLLLPPFPPSRGERGERRRSHASLLQAQMLTRTQARTHTHTHTHYNKNGVVCSNKTKIMITSIARLTPYLSRQDRHSKMMAFTPSSWNTRDDR